MDQGLSGFDVEAVVLAGLAAVRPAHLSCHIVDPQYAIIALHLKRAIRHQRCYCSSWPTLLHPRPHDDGEHGDMGNQTTVRWLSLGKVLKRVQGKAIPELSDAQWMADLAFAVDVTALMVD
ncbi:hypothetical protein XENOCAPTIV_021923 [Xenoophorus captivus]|uniref:Uncharacterized protein n=1 Tax=Xenoophorus captivus TaxID=1517983 RepID=A0ABV0R9Z2_9TELE